MRRICEPQTLKTMSEQKPHCLYFKTLPDSLFAWIIRVSVGFLICLFSEMLSLSMFFIKINISNITF